MISPESRPQCKPVPRSALFAAMVCTLAATGAVAARWIPMRAHRSCRFLLALAFCSVALPQAVSAAPVTIGFDAVTTNGVFNYGPVTEDGFVYDLLPASGGLFGWNAGSLWGTPAPSMEGYVNAGGGTLRIRRSDLGTFTFVSADIANYLGSENALPQTIEFIGLLSGVTVGTDGLWTSGGNWTTQNVWTTAYSVALAGVWIDELQVKLGAGFDSDKQWAESVDSLVLLVDAPTPLALLGLGMALIGYGRRGAARQR